jgi:hypothetical protein
MDEGIVVPFQIVNESAAQTDKGDATCVDGDRPLVAPPMADPREEVPPAASAIFVTRAVRSMAGWSTDNQPIE